jgi:tRNA(Ile)-lysidine synthase
LIHGKPSLRTSWSTRWQRLARSVGLDPSERVLIALSGGADSVLLLHLLAAARPRLSLRAVHIDHGLRGEESRADARFCRNLCHALGVPFVERRIPLDPDAPSLEARARDARYLLLAEECRRTGHRTLLTGHHSDDVLETLLMRWIRGTPFTGLRGTTPTAEYLPPTGEDRSPVRLVRPLVPMRREEVRRLLSDRGLRWREDRSNRDPRFTRNRVRHSLLPTLKRICGESGIENLRAFGQAVEGLEDRLAHATAHLSWQPAPHAFLAGMSAAPGGVLERAPLMRLASPLRRRALWRLLLEGTGTAPPRRLLDPLLDDLGAARCGRHALPGGWNLWLRSSELQLLGPLPRDPLPGPLPKRDDQPLLPFAPPRGRASGATFGPGEGLALPLPGIVTLTDGRRLSAEVVERPPGELPPTSGLEVEIDADSIDRPLSICLPWPGARYHPLGAPGSRRLVRFLADRGVPREFRTRLPLVCAGERILWVAGFEPCESSRIGPATRRRLHLALHAGDSDPQSPPDRPVASSP